MNTFQFHRLLSTANSVVQNFIEAWKAKLIDCNFFCCKLFEDGCPNFWRFITKPNKKLLQRRLFENQIFNSKQSDLLIYVGADNF